MKQSSNFFIGSNEIGSGKIYVIAEIGITIMDALIVQLK